MEPPFAAAVVDAIRQVWPAQTAIVGERRLSVFVSEDVPHEDILDEIECQDDPGQRMDLAAALEIVVAALTVLKLLIEIRKLLHDARKTTEQLQTEVMSKLKPGSSAYGLHPDKVRQLIEHFLGSGVM